MQVSNMEKLPKYNCTILKVKWTILFPLHTCKQSAYKEPFANKAIKKLIIEKSGTANMKYCSNKC